MDQLFCMKMFTRVVELGSFTRASEEFQVARPTATTCVAKLEKRLGVRLLQRTTRRLSLTDEGRAYYDSCVRILGDLAEAEDGLGGANGRPHGKLRVSTPTTFARVTLCPSLPRFFARFPELQLELLISDRTMNLVEEGLDCAVRASAIPDDSTLVARHISDFRWATCASPAYLKARGTPKSVDDLAKHNCVRFLSPATGRTVAWQFQRDGKRLAFTPCGNFGVTAMEAAGSAALHGIGIAQVPEPLVCADLREGNLKALLGPYAAPAPPISVVYPSNRYLSAKVRAFADFVAEIFPEPGP